jgi:hypothetical protein
VIRIALPRLPHIGVPSEPALPRCRHGDKSGTCQGDLDTLIDDFGMFLIKPNPAYHPGGTAYRSSRRTISA